MLAIKQFKKGSIDWINNAVYISLFTDARASDDVVLDPMRKDDYRGGDWSEIFPPASLQKGSLLWTLQREKLTQSIISKYEMYAQDALDWLAPEYVRGVSVTAMREDDRVVLLIDLETYQGEIWTNRYAVN